MIVDTPPFTCLQWLFLASVLGPDRVALPTAAPVAADPAKVKLVPVGLWRRLPLEADLFVSTCALNESAPAVQEAVAEGGWFGARHLLMGMRGLDAFTSAYELLDRAPNGRDEHELSPPHAWLRRAMGTSRAHLR